MNADLSSDLTRFQSSVPILLPSQKSTPKQGSKASGTLVWEPSPVGKEAVLSNENSFAFVFSAGEVMNESHRESRGECSPRSGAAVLENPPRQQKAVVPCLPLSQKTANKAESR